MLIPEKTKSNIIQVLVKIEIAKLTQQVRNIEGFHTAVA